MAHYMPEATNMHPYGAWSMASNTNSLVVYGPHFFQSQYIAHYNGVKTGTTPLAGNCLIGSGITHGGQQIIAVILGGSVYRRTITLRELALPVQLLNMVLTFRDGTASHIRRLFCPFSLQLIRI